MCVRDREGGHKSERGRLVQQISKSWLKRQKCKRHSIIFFELGLSLPLFEFFFLLIVHWQITIDTFTMVNDVRKLERRRRSMDHSITLS